MFYIRLKQNLQNRDRKLISVKVNIHFLHLNWPILRYIT